EYIIEDGTSLYDIIQQAGGLTARADLDNAIVLNRAVFELPDPELELLRSRPMSDMTPLEYNYLRTSLRQSKGIYNVDFNRLMESAGKEGNLILNNGDYIYIPEKTNTVWVSGHVRNPGLQNWVEGKTWQEYVETAGGFANNRKATGIRIIRANSGNWEKAKKDTVLHPGDTVFIPEQIDRSVWTDVKDIITLLSSTITIIVGVQNLTK
ncbi:MAG TPA: SLBB domain-containing protein, partial [Candidatus Cloacimonadota bacterium]|nr:SLBB domain-containing protein [Candidatus Cloacimonadota bacterium]